MKSKKQSVSYEAPSVDMWNLNIRLKILHSFSSDADIQDIEDGEDFLLQP